MEVIKSAENALEPLQRSTFTDSGYFKPSDPLRRSLQFVEKRLAGVGSLDVFMEAPEDDTFKSPALLSLMETMQRDIERLPGVDKVVSLVDFLKDMNQAFHGKDSSECRLPASRTLIAQYLLLYDTDELREFVNDSYRQARLMVRLSEHRSSEQARLIAQVRKIAEHHVPKGLTVRITGRAVQDVNIIDALVNGQLQSLALAATVIWVIMILTLHSWQLGFLSLLPNVFPIVLNFGIMGLCGIPLNTATALIAAVAIGMAVDNTIHFLALYSERLSQKLEKREAVDRVISSKGTAMIASSLTLVIAFGILGLSHFTPTIHFGLLSAIMMITALVGDLLLLPGLILFFQHRERPMARRRWTKTDLLPKAFKEGNGTSLAKEKKKAGTPIPVKNHGLL